jgi:hypothetical protein
MEHIFLSRESIGMGHFGQIVHNNIYNKYVLVAAPSDQLPIAIGCLLL